MVSVCSFNRENAQVHVPTSPLPTGLTPHPAGGDTKTKNDLATQRVGRRKRRRAAARSCTSAFVLRFASVS